MSEKEFDMERGEFHPTDAVIAVPAEIESGVWGVYLTHSLVQNLVL